MWQVVKDWTQVLRLIMTDLMHLVTKQRLGELSRNNQTQVVAHPVTCERTRLIVF